MRTLSQSRFCRLMFPQLMLICIAASLSSGQVLFKQPQPGDVYREYTLVMSRSTNDWRVTDPNATFNSNPPGNNPSDFLPNPTLDLGSIDKTNAVRAEALITLWGGHIGTQGKKIRFNDNAWIPIPELASANGIPSGHDGQCYLNQINVVVDVPLSDLVTGNNNFQGENSGQTCGDFGWGQHGMYAMVLRVYYDPASTSHPTGTITSPTNGGTLSENPNVTATASGGAGVNRVDFLAYYEGYDTDGDGVFQEYHHDYHVNPSEQSANIKNHVGTATGSSPYQVTWNTQWVPDQAVGSVKLLARIRDNNDIWYVTPAVENLSLQRVGSSVKLYKPLNIPEAYWVRDHQQTVSSEVNIPGGDNLSDAVSAALFVRTWNGINGQGDPPDNYTKVNGWTAPDYGQDHYFSLDVLSGLPPSNLTNGTNTIEFFANSIHHGIEILWPGPAVMVQYSGNYSSPQPPAPTLASPVDNAPNQPPTLTLKWNPALTATSYRLQVSTDPGFGSTVVDDSTVTDTAKQVGPLANLTTYYWRVRGKSAAGSGPYSSVRSFTTFLAAPVLFSPADNATNQPTSLTLRWNAASGVLSYRLQVATDAGFASGVAVNDSTIVDTFRVVSGLANSTQYYWRVNAKNAGGTSGYSATRSFTTVVSPAAAPTLVSPSNGATNQPTNVTVVWTRPATTTSFRLQVGTDSTFASGMVVNDSTLADTFKVMSGLSNNTKYFWRVNAKNPGGTSPYSVVRSFTTIIGAPPAPLLSSPPKNALNQPTSITLQWNASAGASTYWLQLGTDSTFVSGLVKNDSTITGTSRVVNGLIITTKYYWRVSAKNPGGTSPFSEVWNFTTAIPVPEQVVLVSPADFAIIGSASVKFVWRKGQPNATRYHIEYAIDSLFAFFAEDSTLTDTTKTVQGLLNNQTYYWRARGGNSGGWGPFSDVRRFNIVVTSVEQDRGVPQNFSLNQNYPNPFNPSTRIEFTLPKESNVRLEIYNLLGECVATVVDETKPSGYYSVEFSALSLPSGIYFSRLTTVDGSFMRKMILLK